MHIEISRIILIQAIELENRITVRTTRPQISVRYGSTSRIQQYKHFFALEFCSRLFAFCAIGSVIVESARCSNIHKRAVIICVNRRITQARISINATNSIAFDNGSGAIGIRNRAIGIIEKADKAAHLAATLIQFSLCNYFTTIVDIGNGEPIGITKNTAHIQNAVLTRVFCDRSGDITVIVGQGQRRELRITAFHITDNAARPDAVRAFGIDAAAVSQLFIATNIRINRSITDNTTGVNLSVFTSTIAFDRALIQSIAEGVILIFAENSPYRQDTFVKGCFDNSRYIALVHEITGFAFFIITIMFAAGNTTNIKRNFPVRTHRIACKGRFSRDLSVVLKVRYRAKYITDNAPRIRQRRTRYHFNITAIHAAFNGDTISSFGITGNAANKNIVFWPNFFILYKSDLCRIATTGNAPISRTYDTAHIGAAFNRAANHVAIQYISQAIIRRTQHSGCNTTRNKSTTNIGIDNIHVRKPRLQLAHDRSRGVNRIAAKGTVRHVKVVNETSPLANNLEQRPFRIQAVNRVAPAIKIAFEELVTFATHPTLGTKLRGVGSENDIVLQISPEACVAHILRRHGIQETDQFLGRGNLVVFYTVGLDCFRDFNGTVPGCI